MSIETIVEEIKKLTVVEVNDLVKKLEEEFGVTAAAVAVAGPAAGAAAPAEAAEKSEFTINLKECGPNKIAVIKVIKEVTGLGLVESKAIADGAPKTVKEKVPAKDAKEIEAKFKEAGATVELV